MRSIFSIANRSVAQLGRALRSGRRGRRFESCHSDFFIAIPQSLKYGLCGFSFFLTCCACAQVYLFRTSFKLSSYLFRKLLFICYAYFIGNDSQSLPKDSGQQTQALFHLWKQASPDSWDRRRSCFFQRCVWKHRWRNYTRWSGGLYQSYAWKFWQSGSKINEGRRETASYRTSRIIIYSSYE